MTSPFHKEEPGGERVSHPWQEPNVILKRYGISLEYEEGSGIIGDNFDDAAYLTVGVHDSDGKDIGEVNLSKDAERKVYQITYSELYDLPKGAGIGTSVYRAIRDYVGKKYGSTVASDYNRSEFANRAWAGMEKSGLAKHKTPDIGLKHKSDKDPSYYEMEALVREYRKAGCKTDADILEMARCYGPVALAEAIAALNENGRENTTVMVVVQANPPGKNVCSFIRNTIADKSKLIVVAQPGTLSSGNYERLLRASMPDCEKKLRVMDAGSSLADAVNSAERNRHYRPGQALQVFCSNDLALSFKQEISAGSLKFDPTVIQVTPVEVPSDDTAAIQKACNSDDLAALHRVLDPHMFSDSASIPEYQKAVTQSESIKSLVDRALTVEFLTDLHDDPEIAKAQLVQVIKQNIKLLDDRGINVRRGKYLGTGNNGSAWQLTNGKVLKVTTDDAEAHIASHVKGKHFKHIFTIDDVWAFPGKINGHIVYGLITEGGLNKLSDEESEEFDWLIEMLADLYKGAEKQLYSGNLKPVLKGMMIHPHIDPRNKKHALELVKKFDLAGICADAKKIGYFVDLHSGNLMKRANGVYVVIDMGQGGSGQERAKPPLIGIDATDEEVILGTGILGKKQMNEFGTGSPGSGANGPAQMKGSNSSAWAGGMMVLLDPEDNIPTDDNASERDGRLDQDITGGGLDWGVGRRTGASI